MTEQELTARTKEFALRVMKLLNSLPRTVQTRTIADQIMRSGISIAANYRPACKARSRAEFLSRLGTVEEEADETAFWIELLIEGKVVPESKLRRLLQGAHELTAIIAASQKSTLRNTKSQIANRNSQIRRLPER